MATPKRARKILKKNQYGKATKSNKIRPWEDGFFEKASFWATLQCVLQLLLHLELYLC